jgi:hypothetical protein
MVNKRLHEIRLIAAAGTTVLLAATAFASALATEIYRWVDADGTVHFGDRPPADHPVQQIQVLPPTGAGPLARGEAVEAASDHPVRPEAVIVPGRLPAAD